MWINRAIKTDGVNTGSLSEGATFVLTGVGDANGLSSTELMDAVRDSGRLLQ